MASFFSEVDKGSATPSWMHSEHIRIMEDSIRQKKYAIENGYVQQSNLPDFKRALGVEEEKLAKIKDSMPKIPEEKVVKWAKDLEDKIGAALFKRSDMMKGTADAHEEARRMSEPIIEISKEIAEACGVTLIKGKCSRSEAEKAWKIVQSYRRAAFEHEVPTNSEALRKD